MQSWIAGGSLVSTGGDHEDIRDTKQTDVSAVAMNDCERRGRRLALSCRVFFFGLKDFEGEARLMDVSTGGCCISSTEALSVGTVLKLSLFLPDHPWPMRIDQAIVRWADGDRDCYGLEFTLIRLAQRERLRPLVMKTRC